MIDYRTTALTVGGFMALDDVNRALVGDLLGAMGHRQSAAKVGEWLERYAHYRDRTHRDR